MSEMILNNENSNQQGFLGTLQTAVTNRTIQPYGNKEPITFEFSQDKALLHQYYRLREIMYRVKHNKDFDLDDYDLGEDFYDKIGHILIARRGNLCLGGCRLIVREGDENWALPMESDSVNFNLRESMPDLPLDKVRHAEISRFAVMEDCGNDDVFAGLCKIMYDKVISADIRYLFVKSPYKMARSWRFIANNFGVKTTKIIEGIHPIDKTLSSEIKWYLVASDLSSLCKGADSVNTRPSISMQIPENLN